MPPMSTHSCNIQHLSDEHLFVEGACALVQRKKRKKITYPKTLKKYTNTFFFYWSLEHPNFPPVSRQCVWVGFISHLNIPQMVTFIGDNPGDKVY